MYRERSNLSMKRERSMLADMGQGVSAPGVNVAMADGGASDGSFESMMRDADGKYNSGDYEGALLVYSMALGSYPEKTEILDGLTKAQNALEEKLASPERQNTSGNMRKSEGVASKPGAMSRSGTLMAPAAGAAGMAGVHVNPFSEEPGQQGKTPVAMSRAASRAAASPYPPPGASRAGASPMIAPTPAFLEPASRQSSMSLPPQSAMDGSTPAPTSSTAMSGALGMPPVPTPRPASKARTGRLSTRPPSAAKMVTARPVTPASAADVRDPKMFVVTSMSKIEEDIAQELWDRAKDRCEQVIEALQKVPKNQMSQEEKETYQATVYNNLGKADFAMGNMDKALEDHNLAIHIAETYGLFDVKTTADAAIGRINMSIGREASTMWEETIRIDKEIAPKPVAPPPIPGNLTRTKTILATEDSPAMVDIAMPAAVRVVDEESDDLQTMLETARAKSAAGDHEGALMLYSAAQTKHPDAPEVERGLKSAESALQRSLTNMTARTEKKVSFNKGWASDDIDEAAVYHDPQEELSLRKYATEVQEQVEQDLQNGELNAAQSACEDFLVRFNTLEDDVTMAERFTFLATTHNQLGRAVGAQGLSDKALDEHNAALQIADRNGLDDVKFTTLDLIARIYLSQGQVDKAISTWKLCIPVCLDEGEKSEIYHKIALAELTQDNYMQARINGDKAAMSAAKANDEEKQFNARIVIGMTLVKSGDRVGALEEYRKALKLAVSLDDTAKQIDVQQRIDALDAGDMESASMVPMEAIGAVMVVATPSSSRQSSRATSRRTTPATSRNQSRHTTPAGSRNQSRRTTPAGSRRTSRAPSPIREADYRMEDETDIISPRAISVQAIKSPRAKSVMTGPSVMGDTMMLLQMYMLLTLPEF